MLAFKRQDLISALPGGLFQLTLDLRYGGFSDVVVYELTQSHVNQSIHLAGWAGSLAVGGFLKYRQAYCPGAGQGVPRLGDSHPVKTCKNGKKTKYGL